MSAEAFRNKKVSEVMEKGATINQNKDIATGFLLLRGISSDLVGVTDDQNKLVGVTTRDRLTYAITDENKDKNNKLKDAMYAKPVTVKPDQTIDEVIKVLNQQQFDKLPVVNADGQMIGAISRKGMLSKLAANLKIQL